MATAQATLYLAEPDGWQRLDALRRSYGPTEIVGQREVGTSVSRGLRGRDVLNESGG